MTRGSQTLFWNNFCGGQGRPCGDSPTLAGCPGCRDLPQKFKQSTYKVSKWISSGQVRQCLVNVVLGADHCRTWEHLARLVKLNNPAHLPSPSRQLGHVHATRRIRLVFPKELGDWSDGGLNDCAAVMVCALAVVTTCHLVASCGSCCSWAGIEKWSVNSSSLNWSSHYMICNIIDTVKPLK